MIWKNGLDAVSAEEIVAGFDTDAECGNNLKHLGISSTRPSSSRNGALDSVTDDRFALPLKDICHSCRAAGKTTYKYVFDQPNHGRAQAGRIMLLTSSSSLANTTFPSIQLRKKLDLR